MTFTNAETTYLRGQRLGRLATQKPTGELQVSPVGFALNEDTGTVDITGYKLDESKKFRNVAANGKVAFVVDDLLSVQPWRPRCVEIRGHGEAVAARDDVQGGPLIRIHVTRIISFGLEETSVDAHRLTISARDVAD